jgi:predicted permease
MFPGSSVPVIVSGIILSVPQLALAVRSLRKAPVFTGAAMVSIAIAMGANATIFSVIDAVLLRPLPGIREPGKLISLYNVKAHDPAKLTALSWPEFENYRRNARSFSGMLAYLRVRFNKDLPGELVSNDYFRVLGIQLRYGRDFAAEEREPVVMISERMGDSKMLGSALSINGHRFTVIGIVPAEYRGIVLDWGDRPQVWIPMKFYRDAVDFGPIDALHAREMRSFVVTGRLAPGATFERAAREVAALADRGRAQDDDWAASAVPLANARFWPGVRSQILSVLTMLFVVAASVLSIACANVAALMLTRAAEQHRDIAVRLSLGARAGDVARLLLMESFLLSAAGCVGGVLIGTVLTRALAAFPRLFSIPLALDLSLDVRVVGFTAAMGILVTVVVGLLPLRQALRTDLIASLRAAGAASGQQRMWNLRSGLTGMQIAFSLVLLVEAGLFVRTFQKAAEVDPFLQSGNLLIGRVETSTGIDRLLVRLRELPGVTDAALAMDLPMSGIRAAAKIALQGWAHKEQVEVNMVSPGFFKMAGVSRLSGRDFTDGDVAGQTPVAIVNSQMASKYWKGDAIGRQFHMGDQTVTVVGAIQDQTRHSYREGIQPRVYFPIAQRSGDEVFLILRTHGNPMSALPLVRSLVAISAPQTLSMFTDTVLAQERLAAWCLSALAGIAFVLSVVGLYGVAAYSVSQRTAEIGIRMALGGTTGRVIGAVLKPAAIVAGLGVVAGTLLSMGATRLSESLFFGVTGGDPATWIAVTVLLIVAVVIATAIPARRASEVEPAVALRGE